MSSPTQRQNSQNVDLLATHFMRKSDATTTWGRAISAINMLPGLRGSWPMGPASGYGGAIDVSGNGRVLTNNNSVLFKNIDLIPCADFLSGSSKYFHRPDEPGLDIIGTEAYIDSSIRGLTLGGWFRFDALGSKEGLLSKWGAATNFSYSLHKSAANNPIFEISTTGAASGGTATSSITLSATTWYFIAGRFDPSTSLSVWVNNTQDDTATAVTTLFNGTQSFDVGRTATGSYLSGEASLCWLCAAALPDYMVKQIYEQTRPLFGVL